MDPGVGSGARIRAVAVRCRSLAAAVFPSLRASASFPLLCVVARCVRPLTLGHTLQFALSGAGTNNHGANLVIPAT